jgi:hypothetical protein
MHREARCRNGIGRSSDGSADGNSGHRALAGASLQCMQPNRRHWPEDDAFARQSDPRLHRLDPTAHADCVAAVARLIRRRASRAGDASITLASSCGRRARRRRGACLRVVGRCRGPRLQRGRCRPAVVRLRGPGDRRRGAGSRWAERATRGRGQGSVRADVAESGSVQARPSGADARVRKASLRTRSTKMSSSELCVVCRSLNARPASPRRRMSPPRRGRDARTRGSSSASRR